MRLQTCQFFSLNVRVENSLAVLEPIRHIACFLLRCEILGEPFHELNDTSIDKRLELYQSAHGICICNRLFQCSVAICILTSEDIRVVLSSVDALSKAIVESSLFQSGLAIPANFGGYILCESPARCHRFVGCMRDLRC